MAEYKNQHYVPQAFLIGFSENDLKLKVENYLFRLDKSKGNIDRKGINHICNENYYYSYLDENGNYNHNLEKMFSIYEREFKKIKHRANCIRNASLEGEKAVWFTRFEKKILIQFIIFQLFRVPAIINPFISKMTNELKKMNEKDDTVQSDEEIINYIKRVAISHMFDINNKNYKQIESILHSKNMILTTTQHGADSTFIITDNPVLITNTQERTAIVNDKTEISMTLSKNIAISFYEYGLSNKIKFINDDGVDAINMSFFKKATNFCFSGNEKALKKLLLTTASTG